MKMFSLLCVAVFCSFASAVDEYRDDITAIRNELKELRLENKYLRRDVNRLNEKIYSLNDCCFESFNVTEGKTIRQVDQPIAFYSYLSADLNLVGKGHTVKFDSVETNIGHGYKSYSGIFSAPVSGVYVFTWTIYTGNHGVTHFSIMVNGNPKGSTLGETNDVSFDYDSDTGTIVVSLNQGDDVFIQSYASSSTKVLSTGKTGITTYFAGWKLN